MKSKKRHQSSSEDSEESEDQQSSSSDSESEDSSVEEQRHKKKKKRERGSSDSDSDSDEGQRRAKKRKHKKKKKKHMKRKKRTESVVNSESEVEAISISDGDVSPKKKHKKHHKHKRSHSSSLSGIERDHSERRLQSVVKERRSSEDRERPPASYYQYHRPASPAENYVDDREREVMRFYRGTSKERRYQEQYPYDQECSNGRNARYEGNHKPPGEYRRPREESYQPREEPRGYNRNHNQYEGAKRREFEEGREFRERRGPPEPDQRYRQREFPDRRERYREEPFHPDRSRDTRRERPPPPSRPDRPPPKLMDMELRSRDTRRERPPPPSRPDRPPPKLMDMELSSHVLDEHYRNKSQQRPERSERPPDRYRDGRDERSGRPHDERSDRPRDDRGDRSREERRPDDRHPADDRKSNDDRRPDARRQTDDRRPSDDRRNDRRPDIKSEPRERIKSEPREREKKSRFSNTDDKEYDWGKEDDKKDGKDGNAQADKEKPNFGLSGKLTADANTVNGVVIKYTEPDDAKQPKRRWRFYPFKGDKSLPILYIHRQSAFLIGRDKKVCDITLDHPSISKQHAALQYRATPFTRADGSQGRRVRPYVIDLESSNGTFVNNKKVEPRRYVELLERDVVKFGFSERDYVLLHENSKDEGQDDDEQPALGAAVTTVTQIKSEKRVKTEITEDGE